MRFRIRESLYCGDPDPQHCFVPILSPVTFRHVVIKISELNLILLFYLVFKLLVFFMFSSGSWILETYAERKHCCRFLNEGTHFLNNSNFCKIFWPCGGGEACADACLLLRLGSKCVGGGRADCSGRDLQNMPTSVLPAVCSSGECCLKLQVCCGSASFSYGSGSRM